jgi:hypothetical protein
VRKLNQLEPTYTGIQQLQPRIPHQESKTTASRVAICDLSCKICAKVGTADERVSSFSGVHANDASILWVTGPKEFSGSI